MAREHLKLLRTSKGLSQPALGKQVGLKLSDISRLELGYGDFREDQAERLAKFFGVSVDEIRTGKPTPPPMAPKPRGLAAAAVGEIQAPPLARSAPVDVKVPVAAPVASAPLQAAQVGVSIDIRSALARFSLELAAPKSFRAMPDPAVLSAKRDVVVAVREFAEKVLHTSGVPPVVWVAWRDHARAIDARLREPAPSIEPVAPISAAKALPPQAAETQSPATISKPIATPLDAGLQIPEQGERTDYQYRGVLIALAKKLAHRKRAADASPDELRSIQRFWPKLQSRIRAVNAKVYGEGKGRPWVADDLYRPKSLAARGNNALFVEAMGKLLAPDVLQQLKLDAEASMRSRGVGFQRAFRDLAEKRFSAELLDQVHEVVRKQRSLKGTNGAYTHSEPNRAVRAS